MPLFGVPTRAPVRVPLRAPLKVPPKVPKRVSIRLPTRLGPLALGFRAYRAFGVKDGGPLWFRAFPVSVPGGFGVYHLRLHSSLHPSEMEVLTKIRDPNEGSE